MPNMLLSTLTGAIALSTLLSACRQPISTATSMTSTTQAKPMTSNSDSSMNAVRSITMLAREEIKPPLGSSSSPDRPIRFASVFLDLENAGERPQTLILESVEVVDAKTGALQLNSDAPKEIQLMPLERAKIDVQLSGPEPYGGSRKVKAIATYRLAEEELSLESPVVEIR